MMPLHVVGPRPAHQAGCSQGERRRAKTDVTQKRDGHWASTEAVDFMTTVPHLSEGPQRRAGRINIPSCAAGSAYLKGAEAMWCTEEVWNGEARHSSFQALWYVAKGALGASETHHRSTRSGCESCALTPANPTISKIIEKNTRTPISRSRVCGAGPRQRNGE